MQVLYIVGSLRKESWTLKVTKAIVSRYSGESEIYVPGDLPLFNQDLESKMPKSVLALKKKVEKANAIVFVTPEHNHSTSAVLKNAIEWGSRPYGSSSWKGKPGAIVCQSPGMTGAVRAKEAVRTIMGELQMHVMDNPEVILTHVDKKFDNGKLVDEPTIEKIQEFLVALSVWVDRFKN